MGKFQVEIWNMKYKSFIFNIHEINICAAHKLQKFKIEFMIYLIPKKIVNWVFKNKNRLDHFNI